MPSPSRRVSTASRSCCWWEPGRRKTDFLQPHTQQRLPNQPSSTFPHFSLSSQFLLSLSLSPSRSPSLSRPLSLHPAHSHFNKERRFQLTPRSFCLPVRLTCCHEFHRVSSWFPPKFLMRNQAKCGGSKSSSEYKTWCISVRWVVTVMEERFREILQHCKTETRKKLCMMKMTWGWSLTLPRPNPHFLQMHM